MSEKPSSKKDDSTKASKKDESKKADRPARPEGAPSKREAKVTVPLATGEIIKGPTPRLKVLYDGFRSALGQELGHKNPMRVPQIKKIVVNIGQGDAVQNIKSLEAAVVDLTLITGQKPIMTRAKKSIATFKLRQGAPIGCCVTLRRQKMYEFLDRFINVAVPRIRDFKGFSPKAFDGRGSYSVGIKEQIIFPEIDYDKVDKIRGLGITIVTDAVNDAEARTLLEKFNFPFRKN